MRTPDLAAIFTRDLTRLAQELRAFPDTETAWRTVPGVSNAAGTLALHLEGNLREFVGRQLGGITYTRDRPAEFSTRGVPLSELVARVERLIGTIPPVVAAVPSEMLERPFPDQVFGYPVSTGLFLLHLSGHLNYHLGQIDYLRRVLTGAGAIELAAVVPPA